MSNVHNRTWGIVLSDDGTLDTVVRCDACNAEYRYNYDSDMDYDDFIGWACDDAAEQHANDIAE